MNSEKRISFQNITVFPLGKIISGLRLKEKGNMPVMNLCEKYENSLKAGKHAFQLCEDFTNELGNIANTDVLRNVVKKCKKILKENERDLANMKNVQSLYESNLSYIAGNIEHKLSVYLSDKSDKNRTELHEAISVFTGNKSVNNILENLSYDEYEVKHGKKLHNLKSVSIKEEKTYTEEEVKNLINKKIKEIESKPVLEKKEVSSYKNIDTHIELNSTIMKILENCGTNKKLADFCMNYYNELNRGVSEEALYESFISGISNWNYMPAVETEISAMKSRTEKYKQEIDIKRILDYMSQTGSYYIVPLIEECVMDYVESKSLQNKAILKQRLVPFEFDPFVRDIENILVYDLSIPNTVYLGESLEKKNNYVHTDIVYSPVLYVKENESIFNIKGMYYVKKGNSISRLPKKDILLLPESFTNICNHINSSDVKFINETNEIKIYSGNDVAIISESAITINGKKVTTGELNRLYENLNIMHDNKAAFYKKIQDLNESFNEIAYIDFVKHVALNEDENHYVDVFRIKNNIFVTTVDKINGISTFYKNVNPIQCRKYINEHMGLNIGEIFEDILPSQESIKKMIVEKRALYEEYIDELRERKEKLKSLDNDPDVLDSDKKSIKDALDIVDDEISKAEKDYKDYVDTTDNYLNGDPSDKENSTDAEAGEYTDPDTGEVKQAETPDEMTTPIEDETNPESDTDISTDTTPDEQPNTSPDDIITVGSEPDIDTTGATEYDPLLDTPATSQDNNEESFKIVDVRYNYNVKANKTENKGELILIIPTVDMNGDIHNEMKRVTFYLDETGKPIINNEYMPLDMYTSIVVAINNNPKTAEVIDDMKSGNIAHRTINPSQSDELSNNITNKNNQDGVSASQTDFDDDIDYDTDTDNNDDFDDFLAGLNLEDGTDDIDKDFNNDNNSNNNSEEDNKPVEYVRQETPEEQREAGNNIGYPVNLALNVNDINNDNKDKFISKKQFVDDLTDAGINVIQSESEESNIILEVKNKADAYWLNHYFRENKGYTNEEFNNFFPELKECMQKRNSTMKCESIILPYTKDYAKMFGINSLSKNKRLEGLKIIFESAADKEYMYKTLNEYAKTHRLDENAKIFINKYNKEKANEYSIIQVPYSSFLHQKMTALNFNTDVLHESLYITINRQDVNTAKNVFKSFYKKDMPTSVKSFINDMNINEGVKITIKDEDGKKVTFDVNKLLKKASEKGENKFGENNPDEDFDPNKSFEQVTTFDASKTLNPYNTIPEADEADDNEEEKSEDKNNDIDKDKDSKDKDKKEKKDDNKEKSNKKKIILKKKNESLQETDFIDELLMESAKPTVMDNVKLNDGRRGQIIFQMANGDFIVNVAGRTVECSQDSVSMLRERPDTLDVPYKFDPNTLKALFEQYVQCGMFMNGIKMTPEDCKVKYSDYANTDNNGKVPVLVENQKLLVDRKYIKILEDVNNFANISDYEKLNENYYYNKKDLRLAESVHNMDNPVRILVNNDNWELITVAANTLKS